MKIICICGKPHLVDAEVILSGRLHASCQRRFKKACKEAEITHDKAMRGYLDAIGIGRRTPAARGAMLIQGMDLEDRMHRPFGWYKTPPDFLVTAATLAEQDMNAEFNDLVRLGREARLNNLS